MLREPCHFFVNWMHHIVWWVQFDEYKPTATIPHRAQAPWTGTTPTGSSTFKCHSNLSTHAVKAAPRPPITSASHGWHNVHIPEMDYCYILLKSMWGEFMYILFDYDEDIKHLQKFKSFRTWGSAKILILTKYFFNIVVILIYKVKILYN